MTIRERAEKLVHSIIENGADKFAVDDAERMIKQAIEEEREACAKVSDRRGEELVKAIQDHKEAGDTDAATCCTRTMSACYSIGNLIRSRRS